MKKNLFTFMLTGILLCGSACSSSNTPSNTMNEPLRYTKLPLFNPHRTTFTCVHQDTVVPSIDPEAEIWFQQGLALTNEAHYEEDKDYKTAAVLWAKAAARKHWKAQYNLAGLYAQGDGVPRDEEKALDLMEELMAWGVPAGWDNMGSYYNMGFGSLKQDSSVAFAFWQKAAEMGSPSAQAYLGRRLLGGGGDSPEDLMWENNKIGLEMLECALAQGEGQAAYELGLEYEANARNNGIAKDKPHALNYYHQGVKFGSKESARSLRIAFTDGPQHSVAPNIDKNRAARYEVLSDALDHNPDLRFPNLDKVLPLPPAKLPTWDSKPESLIEAAKGLRPLPYKPKTTSNNGTGRYAIPEGHKLVPSNHPDASDMSKVPATAYWKPYAYSQNPYITNLVNQVPAGLYQAGEAFDKIPDPATGHNCGGVRWQCYVLVDNRPAQHPRIVAGLERGVEKPDNLLQCAVGEPCPATGTWRPLVINDHPMARTINQLWRQGWFTAGATMPDLPENMGVDSNDVTWQLLEIDVNADKV